MLKNDPFIRQESRRACTQQANDIRNVLYHQGQSISGKAQRNLNDENANRDDVLISLGEVSAYIDLRKSLAPTIGMDQFTQSLGGTKNKLQEKVASLEPLLCNNEDSQAT